jgi:hypothetical protein
LATQFKAGITDCTLFHPQAITLFGLADIGLNILVPGAIDPARSGGRSLAASQLFFLLTTAQHRHIIEQYLFLILCGVSSLSLILPVIFVVVRHDPFPGY